MNEKVLEFIQGLGALTEIWLITYNNFKKQGLNDSEAFTHTREFMKVMLATITNGGANNDFQ